MAPFSTESQPDPFWASGVTTIVAFAVPPRHKSFGIPIALCPPTLRERRLPKGPRMYRYYFLFVVLNLFTFTSANAEVRYRRVANPPVRSNQVARLVTPVYLSQPSKISVGFEGGLTFGSTSIKVGGASQDSEARKNFAGGAYVDIAVSPYFSISPELLYLSKGVSSGGVKYKFDFVEMPVLAKVKFATGSVRPFVFAGPSVGIPMSKSSEASDGTVTGIDGGGLVDLSLNAGVGLEFDLGRNVSLTTSGRYIHGFVDQTTESGQEIYNRTLLFMTGLRIGL